MNTRLDFSPCCPAYYLFRLPSTFTISSTAFVFFLPEALPSDHQITSAYRLLLLHCLHPSPSTTDRSSHLLLHFLHLDLDLHSFIALPFLSILFFHFHAICACAQMAAHARERRASHVASAQRSFRDEERAPECRATHALFVSLSHYAAVRMRDMRECAVRGFARDAAFALVLRKDAT